MDMLHDKWYKVVPCGKRVFAVTEVSHPWECVFMNCVRVLCVKQSLLLLYFYKWVSLWDTDWIACQLGTHTLTDNFTHTHTNKDIQSHKLTLTRVTGTHCLSVDSYLYRVGATVLWVLALPFTCTPFKGLEISRQSKMSVSTSLVCESRSYSTPFGHLF